MRSKRRIAGSVQGLHKHRKFFQNIGSPDLTACTFCSMHSFTKEGRAIHWLADLVMPVSDLIAEHDRHLELGAEDEGSADAIESSTEYVFFVFFPFFEDDAKCIIFCPEGRFTFTARSRN